MSPCSRKAREYGLKLLFLKTEVEKSGYTTYSKVLSSRKTTYSKILGNSKTKLKKKEPGEQECCQCNNVASLGEGDTSSSYEFELESGILMFNFLSQRLRDTEFYFLIL